MAASTEGFNDTSMPGKDHLGSIISKVLAARRLAQDERQRAEQIAEDNQTSLEEAGIEKGYFFKAALGHEFYGDFVGKQKEKLGSIRQRFGLLKKGKFWDAIEGKGEAEFKVKSSLQRFRDKIGINDIMIDDPALRPRSDLPLVEDPTEEVSEEISGGPKRISREQLLASVSQIAKALEATASSITKTATENSGLASSIGSMNRDVVSQISERTGTLEDKLQQIADAINAQTQYHKSAVDKEEDAVSEEKMEAKRDAASTVVPDNLMTPEDESAEESSGQMIDARQQQEQWREQMLNDRDQTPGFERGTIPDAPQNGSVIMDGPDSGYPIMLHGKERVTIEPIDNNYTQGQPSAIDGKTRSKPSQRQYEMGTKSIGITPERGTIPDAPQNGSVIMDGPDSGYPIMLHGKERVTIEPIDNNYTQGQPSAIDGKTRSKPSQRQYEMGTKSIGITPMQLPDFSGVIQKKYEKPLMQVAELLPKAVGAFTLKATTDYMNEVGKDNPIASEMAQVQRPIAEKFGLSGNMTAQSKNAAILSKKESTVVREKSEKESVFKVFINTIKRSLGMGGSSSRSSSSSSNNSNSNSGGSSGPATASSDGMEGNVEQREFASEIYDMAVAAGAKHPEVAAAIASLETGWGEHEKRNNPFNMRGVDGNFLEFASKEDAVKEFVRLWDKNHSGYMNLEAYDDPNEAFAAIVDAYAPASDGNNPEKYKQFVANFIASKMYLKKPPKPVENSEKPETPSSPKITASDLKPSLGKIDKIGTNKGTGESVKVPGVGTFVSGRGFFGRGEDKYFDQNGNKITFEEFTNKIKETAGPPAAPGPKLDPTLSPTPPQQTTPDQTLSSLQPQPKAAAAAQLVALNTGGAEQNPPATLSPPTASDSSVPAGSSQSLDAFYNPTPVA